MDVKGFTLMDLPTRQEIYHLVYDAMRQHGVETNDKAHYHNGLQNLIVDDFEFPLTIHRGLLCVPLRESMDEDLLKWHILDLVFDDPCDPWDLND